MTQSLSQYVAGEVRAETARQRVSQRALAEVLGLSQGQVSARMGGDVEFRLSELERIAVLLKVPITHFLPVTETATAA